MKTNIKTRYCAGLLGCIFITITAFTRNTDSNALRFPYAKAGLTKQQAAEHLLSRFTYGATPQQVDAVLKEGIENWFIQQLAAALPDDELNQRLSIYDGLQLTNAEVCKIYPPGFVVRNMAIKDSVISKDSVGRAVDKKAFNAQIQAYMDQKGLRSDQDLYKQFIDQNIIRAVYTQNQLQEVMTDFWFNHFNVSFFKGECAQFIPAYERDVIRPNALGKFNEMLIASAQSPAMLYYLDNFTSVGQQPQRAGKPKPAPEMQMTDNSMMMSAGATSDTAGKKAKTITQPGKNINGLNENYAREVMELHTIGVDGGYTQQDVTQAARVLTGWTVYPISETSYGSAMKGLVAKIGDSNLAQKGFVRKGDFLFTPNRHDHGEKQVLGHTYTATNDPAASYQEGIDLLEMLAHHPSTARFICRKLAVRFVRDNPPKALVDKMAKSFTEHNGDIRQVLLTMVSAKEFWSKPALLAKTKSPFELAISAVRCMNADVKDPYPLYNWIARMGEKRYYYQAPTGFPDRAGYWINTGALLNRMDFSLALVTGQINGVTIQPPLQANQDNAHDLPGTIKFYSQLLTPGADPQQMVTQLSPLLKDSLLLAKARTEVVKIPVTTPALDKPVAGAPGDMMLMGEGIDAAPNKTTPAAKDLVKPVTVIPNTTPADNITTLVTGIIIGSPAFQKR